MDLQRYQEWVRLSFRGAHDPAHDLDLPHHVQLLGIVDAELRGIRPPDLFDPRGQPHEDDDGILLAERAQILAHLWVLGAYEYLRTLSEKVKKKSITIRPAAEAALKTAKRDFARIRIPLAKREANTSHKGDLSVPLPGVGPEGLGWEIRAGTILYLETLSDEFLAVLKAIGPRGSP